MDVQAQINQYIAAQPAAKGEELRALHQLIVGAAPDCRLWFLDGRNGDGKVVTNPNIGYGATELKYADGGAREFYQIGLSANSSGISVYVMGVDDKTHLATTYGGKLGKAKITGYCISFRRTRDIDIGVLEGLVEDYLGPA
jgi:hypothetical protein